MRSVRGGDKNRSEPLPETPPLPGNPLILRRDQHCISRKNIDPDALKVMHRLMRSGYRAFLVGGGVRDLLLMRTPKDYDIATDARPETVRRLFRNSRIIGRRFRINHVYFSGNKIIEVATFRAGSGDEEGGDLVVSDNTYGDPQTDAARRDLTINGLFYDLSNFSVVDYVGGIDDLRHQVVRIIGNPEKRIREDPIRMVRAVRHAARTGFIIESETYDAMCRLASLVAVCSPARVSEEFSREMVGGNSLQSLHLLDDTGLLQYFLPVLSQAIAERRTWIWSRLEAVLAAVDDFIKDNVEVPLGVAFLAALIGNLPSDFLTEDEEQRLIRAVYWEVVPQGKPLGNSSRKGLIEGEEVPKTRGRPKRVPLSSLGRAVKEALDPLRIPRKDRELMEQLLYARSMMFHAFSAQERPGAILALPYLPQAMMLLTCTAIDDVSRRCLAYWEAMRREGEFEKKRRRRRRRSPGVRRAPKGGDVDG